MRNLAPTLLVGALAASTLAAHVGDGAAITGPSPDDIVIEDSITLTAYDATDVLGEGSDLVNWALRPDCDAGTFDLVAGGGPNVGRDDPSSYGAGDDGATFTATVDLSDVAPGAYCFVFNPVDTDTRLAASFFIVDDYVDLGGNVVLDGAESGNQGRPGFTHAFGGLVADAGDAGIVGSITVNYRGLGESVTYEATELTLSSANGVFAPAADAKAIITTADGDELQVLGAGESPDFDRGAVIVRAVDDSATGPYDVGNDSDGDPASGADSWVALVNGNAHVEG